MVARKALDATPAKKRRDSRASQFTCAHKRETWYESPPPRAWLWVAQIFIHPTRANNRQQHTVLMRCCCLACDDCDAACVVRRVHISHLCATFLLTCCVCSSCFAEAWGRAFKVTGRPSAEKTALLAALFAVMLAALPLIACVRCDATLPFVRMPRGVACADVACAGVACAGVTCTGVTCALAWLALTRRVIRGVH